MKNLSKPSLSLPNLMTESLCQHLQKLSLNLRKNKSFRIKPTKPPSSQNKLANQGDPRANLKQNPQSPRIRARWNQINDLNQLIPIFPLDLYSIITYQIKS